MIRSALLTGLILISTIVNAQKFVVFERMEGNTVRKYALPRKVTCFYQDGTQRQLVLRAVKRDSLLFERYYNQTGNFDCTYSSLRGLRIHKRGESLLYSAFAGSMGVVVAAAVAIPYLYVNSGGEYGRYNLFIADVIWLPAAVTYGISAVATYRQLPVTHKPAKWAIHVE